MPQAKAKPRRQWQPWTQAEIDYLLTWWGVHPPKQVARYLGRSLAACRVKAYELGICLRTHMFSAREVSRLLGEHREVVAYLIRVGKLHAQRANIKARYQLWRIEAEDLESFLGEHPDLYDYRRINREMYPFWRNLAERVQTSERKAS
jgi:hypothetical protein